MMHITFFISWIFSLPFLNKKLPFFIFSFWILLMFMVLRYDFGNDYMSYLKTHDNIQEGRTTWGQVDILYEYINILIPNFYWLITIISIFYILAVYFLIMKNLKINYYWFAVLLLLINPYLFLIHLSSLAQTIAICFVIFAMHYAAKRKLSMYIILIVIASGFHQSALLLLPVYFLLSQAKIGRAKFLGIFGVLGLMFFTPIWDMLLNAVLQYFPQYNHYVEQSEGNSLRATLISSFFFLLVVSNINKLEGKDIVYGKLALMATTISLLAMKLSMLTRVGMYFDIFLIIAIPLIFSKFRNTASKQVLFIILISIYLLRYVSFFANPIWEPFVDYKTIMGY